MEDSFKKQIIEQIQKSGFPLELELTQKLREKNILTFSNLSFQDKNGYIHEIDLFSILPNRTEEWKYGAIGTQLLIECKKTDKYPWVFFHEGYNPINGMGILSNADYSTDFAKDGKKFNILRGCMNTALAGHHYNDLTVPVARTYFEAFKAPNESTSIYKAVNSIFHSRKYISDNFNKLNIAHLSTSRTFLNSYTIVLDGKLILASKDGNSFNIEETNHLLLMTTDTLAKPVDKILGNEIVIDIIHKEYFETFLEEIQHENLLFGKHLIHLENSGVLARLTINKK